MLRQEINLYRAFETPLPAANFLSWKRFGYSQLFFLGFLCVIYVYSLWQVHHLNVTKLALQTQADELQKKFFDLKKNYPQLFFSQDVGQSVSLMQKDLEMQKMILQSLVTPIPFSQNLIAFSTDIVPDVWLTTISLSKSGNVVILKGKSTTIETLQKFILNLLHDKTFVQFDLNVDDITRPEKSNSNTNLIFQLSITKRS